MRLRLRGRTAIVVAAVLAAAGGAGLFLWLRGRGGSAPAELPGDAGTGDPGRKERPRLDIAPRAGAGPHQASGVVIDVGGRPVADVSI
ncbi:MAG TPA: hypothetical protein VL172_04070, partial [Kofleriaceae bacterium]|nr:hypothetical protein [Kofleriaceae bacterium]